MAWSAVAFARRPQLRDRDREHDDAYTIHGGRHDRRGDSDDGGAVSILTRYRSLQASPEGARAKQRDIGKKGFGPGFFPLPRWGKLVKNTLDFFIGDRIAVRALFSQMGIPAWVGPAKQPRCRWERGVGTGSWPMQQQL